MPRELFRRTRPGVPANSGDFIVRHGDRVGLLMTPSDELVSQLGQPGAVDEVTVILDYDTAGFQWWEIPSSDLEPVRWVA